MGYYVVVDLEMCKVPKSAAILGFKGNNEVIQIGAVCLDEEYNFVDHFDVLVKPQFGSIDSHVEELTGIKNSDLSDAVCAEEAFKAFSEWIPEGEVTMVTWSRMDGEQFRTEIREKQIVNVRLMEAIAHEIDAQQLFAAKMKSNRHYALTDALLGSKIVIQGSMHNAYFDALNTAELFKKLKTEPDYEVDKTRMIRKGDSVPEPLVFGLGSLLGNIKLDMCS